MSLFDGTPTPGFMSTPETLLNFMKEGQSEGAAIGQGFARGFGLTEEQAFQKAQQQQAMKTMAPMVQALKDVKSPEDAFGVFSQNPAWLVNPQTGPFAQKLLSDYTNIAKAEALTVEGKVKLQDSKDFSKGLAEVDPESRAKISAMPRNPDGTPSAQQLSELRQAQAKIPAKPLSAQGKTEADAQAAEARGDMDAAKRIREGRSTAKTTAAITNQNHLQELEKQAREAEVQGDTQEAKDARNQVNEFRALIERSGFSITTNPDGTVTVTSGKTNAPGDLTSGAKTQLQEKLGQYQDLNSTINTLQQAIRPEHVGLRGVVGEVAVDRGLAQLNPEWASRDRITTRELISFVNQELLRKISNDNTGRFTVGDRQEAMRAMISLGAHESYPNVIAKLDVVKGIIARRAKDFSGQMKAPIPNWVLPSMSDEELLESAKTGRVSFQDMQNETNRRYPK